MILLSKLTEKDLEVLKGKKVFLYSLRFPSMLLQKTLKFLNVDVIGYTIYSREYQPSRKHAFKLMIQGYRYVRPEKLESFFQRFDPDDILILPISNTTEDQQEIERHANAFNLKISPLLSGEIISSFSYLMELSFLRSAKKFIRRKCRVAKPKKPRFIMRIWEAFCNSVDKNTVFICSPRKTGDHALNHTFKDCAKNGTSANFDGTLVAINLWHRPDGINRAGAEQAHKRLKIIMGVREPISQNLSSMYQEIGAYVSIENVFYQELFETCQGLTRKQLIEKYEKLFETGMSVQEYWNILMALYLNAKPNKLYRPGFIQEFIPEFAKYALDITAYPFDQEKGYTIINEGNTEVFVYQLEKLNSLVPELSQWVGVPFDKLERGNVAEDKWIAESYKQAQKEIKITQEYFDKCFDEPYVKHCYSEADIEKFKACWHPHIV